MAGCWSSTGPLASWRFQSSQCCILIFAINFAIVSLYFLVNLMEVPISLPHSAFIARKTRRSRKYNAVRCPLFVRIRCLDHLCQNVRAVQQGRLGCRNPVPLDSTTGGAGAGALRRFLAAHFLLARRRRSSIGHHGCVAAVSGTHQGSDFGQTGVLRQSPVVKRKNRLVCGY